MQTRHLLFVIITLLVVTSSAFSQDVPQLIFYQGNLANASGNPIDGDQTMNFIIWNSETGTDPADNIWEELHTVVPVNEGLFSVILGSQNSIPLEVFSAVPRYLEIVIGAETLSPRQQIVSVPYAYTSASVSGASNVFPSEGNIGIGTTNPATHLHTHGSPVTSRGQISISSPPGEDTYISFYEDNNFKAYLRYDDGADDLYLQNFNETNSGDLSLNPYGGNVGIGTRTPAAKLEVAGIIRSTTGGFKFPDGTTQTTASTGGGADGDWTISGNNMYSAVSGNVGIGTTNPLASLHIEGSQTTFGNYQNLFIKTDSPFGANIGGGIGFGGTLNSGGGYTQFAAIAGRKENSTEGDKAGILAFATMGISDGSIERVRITSVGNVGIGDTSPTHTLDVAGKIGINDTQILYLPDQSASAFLGTLIIGTGGGSLSHTITDDGQYNTAVGIDALNANTNRPV